MWAYVEDLSFLQQNNNNNMSVEVVVALSGEF